MIGVSGFLPPGKLEREERNVTEKVEFLILLSIFLVNFKILYFCYTSK